MTLLIAQLTELLADGPGGFDIKWVIGIGLAMMVFIMLTGRGQRREKVAHEKMLADLAKNDKVVTRGGIMGVVTEVKDDELVIKVDENTNTKIRMKRWAIAGLVSKDAKDSSEPKE